jgi:hypothetical protein
MTDITGLHEARQRIGQFSWSAFRIVRSAAIDARGGAGGCVIRLVVESEGLEKKWRLALVATGVRGLRLSEWGPHIRIIGFDCVDISDPQWEGVRWEVRDYEGDLLHFYCADLAIERVEELT